MLSLCPEVIKSAMYCWQVFERLTDAETVIHAVLINQHDGF